MIKYFISLFLVGMASGQVIDTTVKKWNKNLDFFSMISKGSTDLCKQNNNPSELRASLIQEKIVKIYYKKNPNINNENQSHLQ